MHEGNPKGRKILLDNLDNHIRYHYKDTEEINNNIRLTFNFPGTKRALIQFSTIISKIDNRVASSRDTSTFVNRVLKEETLFENLLFKDPIDAVVKLQEQEYGEAQDINIYNKAAQNRYLNENLTESSAADPDLAPKRQKGHEKENRTKPKQLKGKNMKKKKVYVGTTEEPNKEESPARSLKKSQEHPLKIQKRPLRKNTAEQECEDTYAASLGEYLKHKEENYKSGGKAKKQTNFPKGHKSPYQISKPMRSVNKAPLASSLRSSREKSMKTQKSMNVFNLTGKQEDFGPDKRCRNRNVGWNATEFVAKESTYSKAKTDTKGLKSYRSSKQRDITPRSRITLEESSIEKRSRSAKKRSKPINDGGTPKRIHKIKPSPTRRTNRNALHKSKLNNYVSDQVPKSEKIPNKSRLGLLKSKSSVRQNGLRGQQWDEGREGRSRSANRKYKQRRSETRSKSKKREGSEGREKGRSKSNKKVNREVLFKVDIKIGSKGGSSNNKIVRISIHKGDDIDKLCAGLKDAGICEIKDKNNMLKRMIKDQYNKMMMEQYQE